MKTLIHILFMLMLAAVAAAGCAKKPAKDPTIAACPEASARIIQQNQLFMTHVVPGVTPAKELRTLRGYIRKATLVKDGEAPKLVAFYQTGLPTCAWLVYTETNTPVVIQDGVIMSVGRQSVEEMTAEGWTLQEAAWPWQRYDFGYIPPR